MIVWFRLWAPLATAVDFCAALQRAGARDEHGQPKVVDVNGGPLTFRYLS